MAGYPACHFFDYSKLFRFLKFHINNIGDPFLKSGYYRINTLAIERRGSRWICRIVPCSEK